MLESLCYHAQQAAEKALKAVLVLQGILGPRSCGEVAEPRSEIGLLQFLRSCPTASLTLAGSRGA